MRKLNVYLDTSVLNFLFADDAPELRDITIEFFNEYVRKNIFNVHISDVVIKEILNTKDYDKKEKLLRVSKDYNLEIIALTDEAESLANIYVKEKVIPESKFEDAEHIAIATVNQFDILLSWNYKHLANFNKKQKVKIINARENYQYPLD
jgi:predicted nucleic acid-binding protein